MRRRLVTAALGGTVLALGLSVGSVSAEPSDQDTAWLAAAHQSNLTEIAGGAAAVQRGTSETVRSLGQMFIDMHTQLDADLTAAATQLGVTLPDAPNAAQQESLARTEAQQGEAFDATWIAEQIAGHRTTLEATQLEIAQGSDATVVGLASAAAPVVQQHLSELERAASDAPTLVQTGDGGLLSDDGGSGWRWPAAAIGALLLVAGAVSLMALRRRA